MKLDLRKVSISREEPLLLREIGKETECDENVNPNGESGLPETDRNPMSSPSSLSCLPPPEPVLTQKPQEFRYESARNPPPEEEKCDLTH